MPDGNEKRPVLPAPRTTGFLVIRTCQGVVGSSQVEGLDGEVTAATSRTGVHTASNGQSVSQIA